MLDGTLLLGGEGVGALPRRAAEGVAEAAGLAGGRHQLLDLLAATARGASSVL